MIKRFFLRTSNNIINNYECQFTACNTQTQFRSCQSLRLSANGSALLSPATRAIPLFKLCLTCRIAPFRDGDSGVQTTSAVCEPVSVNKFERMKLIAAAEEKENKRKNRAH
jgi:hypothetical protein